VTLYDYYGRRIKSLPYKFRLKKSIGVEVHDKHIFRSYLTWSTNLCMPIDREMKSHHYVLICTYLFIIRFCHERGVKISQLYNIFLLFWGGKKKDESFLGIIANTSTSMFRKQIKIIVPTFSGKLCSRLSSTDCGLEYEQ